MTVFSINLTMRDAYKRIVGKRYETEDITDVDIGAEFLAAYNAFSLLLADIQALTQAEVLRYSVGLVTQVTDSAGVGANRDEGITLLVEKGDGLYGNLKMPAPDKSVVNTDGTVDVTNAKVTDYYDNFTAAGSFTFSDGEKAVALLSGRLDK